MHSGSVDGHDRAPTAGLPLCEPDSCWGDWGRCANPTAPFSAGRTGVAALAYAAGFAVGTLVGAGVALSRARTGVAEGSGEDDLEAGMTLTTSSTSPPPLRALLASPFGGLAV